MMARYLGVAGLVPFISLSGGSRPVLEAAVAYLPSGEASARPRSRPLTLALLVSSPLCAPCYDTFSSCPLLRSPPAQSPLLPLHVRHLLTSAGIGAWLLENADLLLVSYGACIASFLGGIHWGAAFAAGRAKDATTQLLWGVAPSVVAFPAVAMPAPWNIALLSNTLIVMVQADIFYAFKGNYPRNLVMLRMSLTLVAVASLIAALADDFQVTPSRSFDDVVL